MINWRLSHQRFYALLFIHLICQYSQQNPEKGTCVTKNSTASLKNSTNMSVPSARFSNSVPLLRRTKFGFEVPNLMLLWLCCGCQAPNIFDGAKCNIILKDYYVASIFAPSSILSKGPDAVTQRKTSYEHCQWHNTPKALNTNQQCSMQKLQQALISWSNQFCLAKDEKFIK